MRLIDADKLIKDFKLLISKSFLGETTVSTQISIGEVASLIKTQPTAHDVDAVVRELEEKSMMYSLNDRDCIFAIPLNDAIEIVKRGGRNE